MAVSWLSRKEKAHVVHLYNICKDMDGLDRVRFNGLDYRLLRTKYAKRLPLIAGCLLEEDILTPLDMEIQKGERVIREREYYGKHQANDTPFL